MPVFNNIKSGDLMSKHQENGCDSELFYKGIIYHYEQKLREQPKCISTLYYWIASYHELALIYQHLGDSEMALKCLLIPHQSMQYISEHHNGDHEQKLIAIKAMKDTLVPLIRFTETNQTDDLCIPQLKSQLSMIKHYHQINH